MQFYIESLGCAKNKVESQRIEAIFLKHSWLRAESIHDADVVVVNSCGFIDSARAQSIESFFDCYGKLKKGAKIVFAGCFVNLEEKTLSHNLKEADLVLKTSDFADFEAKLLSLMAEFDSSPKNSSRSKEKLEDLSRLKFTTPTGDNSENFSSVYLKISEGCNHNCSFCSIPIIKGPLTSYNKSEILDEIKFCLDTFGTIEFNIIAQDLLSYGYDDRSNGNFLGLLEDINKIEGNFFVRLLYMHPDAFNLELARFISNNKKRFIPYYDLAFQSGSDKILKAMGRRHGAKYYLSLVEGIRQVDPNSIVRSSIMLGFPGETKKTIEETRAFLEEAQLDYVAFFKYSREKRTKSYSLKPSYLSNKQINDALSDLRIFTDEISADRLGRFCNSKDFDSSFANLAIVEGVEGDRSVCRLLYLQAPEVDGVAYVGSAERVKLGEVIKLAEIRQVSDYDFSGEEGSW